jgi:hypothetical protein
MMRTRTWGLAALVVSTLGVGMLAAADDPVLKSGLQPGDAASPFTVDDVTGPNKGSSLCYR